MINLQIHWIHHNIELSYVDNFYVFGPEQFLSAVLGADAYKMKCLGLGTKCWKHQPMMNGLWIYWRNVGKLLGKCWEHVGLSAFALDNDIFHYAVLGHCGIDVRHPHFFLNFQSIATSFFTVSWKFCRWCKLLVRLHGHQMSETFLNPTEKFAH